MLKGFKHSLATITKMRESKIGKKNPMWGRREDKAPNWKGKNVSAKVSRQRARRKYKPPKGIDIHHIDGNPLNNEPSNLKMVTRKKHFGIDRRWEKRARDNWGRFT